MMKQSLIHVTFTSFHSRFAFMHAMGIHSALAIKRQRKRRDDQKRARDRRYSIQSTESGETHSPHSSTRRKHRKYGHHNNVDSKVRLRGIPLASQFAIPPMGQQWGWGNMPPVVVSCAALLYYSDWCCYACLLQQVVCNRAFPFTTVLGGHKYRNAPHWRRFLGVRSVSSWRRPDSRRCICFECVEYLCEG